MCKNIRVHERDGLTPPLFLQYIKKGGLLAAYLKAHRSEVTDMCITEYNEELHERTLKAEGREEGRAEGMAEMAVQLIKDGLLTVAEGAKRLQIPEADLRKMM